MIILLLSILNDEQRALVERIFHEHNIHFQRISFNIVKSEETAKDAVSAAFVKIMENIEKISDLPCPQMTAFCVTIVKNTSIDVLRQLPQSIHIDYWDNISDANVDTVLDECIQFRKRYVKQICARINIYVDTAHIISESYLKNDNVERGFQFNSR